MQRKSFLSIFFALFLVSMLPAQQLRLQKNHPLSAKDTIRDNAIIVPEDMERNYDQLLFDWNKEFLPSRSCFKSDDDNIIYTDSVYVDRLYALPTLMEMAYNQVTRAYIDMYTSRRRTQVEYMLAIGKYFFPIFEQALDKYNVPLELKYLPVIESALNPTALSRAGASGLWQFMAPTGKRYDLEVNSLVDERRDPIKSTEAAARYLKDLYKIYQDWNLVIAAYNCGPGNVNKAIRRSGGKKDYWEIYPYLPRETRGYVPAFIAANYVMTYYKYHNLCPLEYSFKDNTDTIHIDKNIHFQQIADVLNIPIEKIREMNPQFKNDIIPGSYRSYAVCLPTTKVCDFISNQDSILAYRSEEFLVHRKIVNFETKQDNQFTSRTIYHKVKRGETLAQVARRYGVSSTELKKWNRLKSSRLASGRRLAIHKQVKVQSTGSSSQNESAEKQTSPTPNNSASPTFAQLQNNPKSAQASVQTQDEDATSQETINSESKERDGQRSEQEEYARMFVKKDKSNSDAASKADKTSDAKLTAGNTKYIYHTVSSGETLRKLAQQYGVTVDDILNWNHLRSTVVKIGQSLAIQTNQKTDNIQALTNPGYPDKFASQSKKNGKNSHRPVPKYYSVKKGDTLISIAEKHANASVREIKLANNLKSDKLSVGQKLKIPTSSF
jgi:LysM repeat protein